MPHTMFLVHECLSLHCDARDTLNARRHTCGDAREGASHGYHPRRGGCYDSSKDRAQAPSCRDLRPLADASSKARRSGTRTPAKVPPTVLTRRRTNSSVRARSWPPSTVREVRSLPMVPKPLREAARRAMPVPCFPRRAPIQGLWPLKAVLVQGVQQGGAYEGD